MKKTISLFTLFIVLVLYSSVSVAATTLSIGDYSALLGETVKIDIHLSNVADALTQDIEQIDTFSFRVLFDPIGLSASNPVPGSIIPTWPTDYSVWFSGAADNDNGQVSFFYSVFFPPRPALSDGVIASFDLTGLALGQYDLRLSEVSFGYGATPVTVTTQDGSISVVPIPSTLLLLGGGLVGVFGLRRKRGKRDR